MLIGKNSFIGKQVLRNFANQNINCVSLGREDLDLTSSSAHLKLKEFLREGDTIVAISAVVPCKSIQDFLKNVIIAENLAKAFSAIKLRQIVNISSDAVYPETDNLINEEVLPSPSTIHGLMHFSREMIIDSLKNIPICHIRPSSIYGIGDPHNSYGPNRFIREAVINKEITLFGEGTELRDFISVTEVASLITRVVSKGSVGVYNAVSGEAITFLEIANAIASISKIRIHRLKSDIVSPKNNRREFNAIKSQTEFPLIVQEKSIDSIINLHKQFMKITC